MAAWLILTATAIFASWAVFRQFGGYDLSPFIDLFWRMRSGEAPGVDFISTFPPIILIFAKAFGALELGWYELTVPGILAAFATFGALLAVTPRQDRSTGLCVAMAMAIAVPLAYTNHVWHSSISQYCAAVFFAVLFHSLGERPFDRRLALSLFAASAILALTKQNVALPVLAASLGFVAVFGGARRWTVCFAIAAGVVSGLACALLYLRMPPAALLATYTAVLGRASPDQGMLFELRSNSTNILTLALCFAAAMLAVRPALALPRRQLLVSLLFAGLSLLPIVTDWDTKLNDVTLPLVVASMAGIGSARSADRTRTAVLLALVAGVLVMAVIGGIKRERMYRVGPGAFWQVDDSHRIARGYFRGLYTGKNLVGVLDGMDRLSASHRNARLFFGPRIEFGYALLRVRSPRQMPLWWHPGSSYALRDEPQVVAAFAANRFDTLVFLGDDRTRMPQALLLYIDRHFRPAGRDGPLELFQRIEQP